MPRSKFANRLNSTVTDVFVEFGDTQQVMEGFGASETYLDPVSDADMDLLFDQSSGIGLSLMRVGIDSIGGTMGTWSNITKAVARGAKIIAMPWTAAAGQKDNNSEINGGHLLTGCTGAWSDSLAAFQATMIANTSGVTSLYALGVQNEPDFQAAYATMIYTTSEMVEFIKVLGPKVAALSPRPLLITPSTSSWSNTWTYADAVLADAAAARYLDRAIGHQYSGMSAPTGNWKGRAWMGEVSTFDGFDASMTNGLVVAGLIHDAIVTGKVSAWIYWWMVRTSQGDNEGLYDTTALTKRLYVLGNYSKFVRPGMVRVGIFGSVSGVNMTAYKNTSTGAFVIVATNTNGSAVQFSVGVDSFAAQTVTPWLTNSSNNLVAQAAIPAGSAFRVSLPASSVTSFVSA